MGAREEPVFGLAVGAAAELGSRVGFAGGDWPTRLLAGGDDLF